MAIEKFETLKAKFLRKGNLVTRRIAEESLIVPIAGDVADLESIYRLDNLGSFVWERLDGQTPLSAIADAICAEYDATRDVVTEDLREFIDTLTKARLIEPITEANI